MFLYDVYYDSGDSKAPIHLLIFVVQMVRSVGIKPTFLKEWTIFIALSMPQLNYLLHFLERWLENMKVFGQ